VVVKQKKLPLVSPQQTTTTTTTTTTTVMMTTMTVFCYRLESKGVDQKIMSWLAIFSSSMRDTQHNLVVVNSYDERFGNERELANNNVQDVHNLPLAGSYACSTCFFLTNCSCCCFFPSRFWNDIRDEEWWMHHHYCGSS
jgi:hypothetical protein